MPDERIDHEPWPLRAALLLVLGALLGLAFDWLVSKGAYQWTRDVARLSGASFLVVGGFVFAFTLERLRWIWAIAFAALCGVVVAAVFYWNGSPEGWNAGEGWRLTASLLAVAIAAPLFQTVRDAGRWRLDYRQLHGHSWTNVVLWFAAWAFVLIVYLLAQLLAGLFDLIGIHVLRDLLRERWFDWMLVGGALGAAVGLFRDRDRVLGLLQRVVTAVLSMLAPILAAGLVLFVLALPFTGLAPLWEQTKATTPILLSAIVSAVILANAVIGNSAEEEAPQRVLRLSAMALGAVMLPLAIVAAVSTGKRIGQYGFTPDRLWALTFVFIALAYALAYLICLVRGRLRWADHARPVNTGFALGLSALALLLATPLVDFGAISTRDQIARLESGKVSPEDFDWTALAFDFGPDGRKALERIRDKGPAALRTKAKEALALTDRWEANDVFRPQVREFARSLRILPKPVPLPEALGIAIAREGLCGAKDCALIWSPGAQEAILLGRPCEACEVAVSRLVPGPKGDWQTRPLARGGLMAPAAPSEKGRAMLSKGRIEIREVSRRQVFVDGRPAGNAFE